MSRLLVEHPFGDASLNARFDDGFPSVFETPRLPMKFNKAVDLDTNNIAQPIYTLPRAEKLQLNAHDYSFYPESNENILPPFKHNAPHRNEQDPLMFGLKNTHFRDKPDSQIIGRNRDDYGHVLSAVPMQMGNWPLHVDIATSPFGCTTISDNDTNPPTISTRLFPYGIQNSYATL